MFKFLSNKEQIIRERRKVELLSARQNSVEVATFVEMGVTPTTTSIIKFRADGGTASNITFGNVYGTKAGGTSVTIDFDNVIPTLEKIGSIAANNASNASTPINGEDTTNKSFKTYAWTGAVSDFSTYYAALDVSPYIATTANSISFKSVAVPDNTESIVLAQYGLTIDGKNYWSGSKASDTKGVINSTVQTISVVGKTLYATDGTSKTITGSDIPKITKFLIKPTTTETAVYVDDIVIGIGRRFEKLG